MVCPPTRTAKRIQAQEGASGAHPAARSCCSASCRELLAKAAKCSEENNPATSSITDAQAVTTTVCDQSIPTGSRASGPAANLSLQEGCELGSAEASWSVLGQPCSTDPDSETDNTSPASASALLWQG